MSGAVTAPKRRTVDVGPRPRGRDRKVELAVVVGISVTVAIGMLVWTGVVPTGLYPGPSSEWSLEVPTCTHAGERLPSVEKTFPLWATVPIRWSSSGGEMRYDVVGVNGAVLFEGGGEREWLVPIDGRTDGVLGIGRISPGQHDLPRDPGHHDRDVLALADGPPAPGSRSRDQPRPPGVRTPTAFRSTGGRVPSGRRGGARPGRGPRRGTRARRTGRRARAPRGFGARET